MPVKLNYQILGEGDPVLILHGLFGSLSNWNPVAKKLAERFQVISVDLRNHGGSEHAAGMTYPDMVEDLRALVTDLALSRVNLIGHSMGGKAAMGFALTHPGLTNKLVVVDAAPVAYEPAFHDYISAMQAVPLDEIKTRNEAERHLAGTVPEAVIRQFLLQNLVRGEHGFAWRINLEALGRDLETISGFPQAWPNESFTDPVCFLAGEYSDYIKPEYGEIIAGLFPAARIQMIEGTGHWVHAEKPEEVINHITAFLQQ